MTTTFDLKSYLNDTRSMINEYLLKIIDSLYSERQLVQAARHSLMAGGKRLRPILSMAAAQSCHADPRMALLAGCAIELVHTYSLIHDDLPTMDNDDLRRGIPTCHKQFSEPIALLAGDALLTLAFQVLARPDPVFGMAPNRQIRIKVISKLAEAAGINGMVEGQMRDMQSYSGDDDTSKMLDHLKDIHQLKTGRMIVVSVESGALSVGADAQQIEKLVLYADKLGLAFQVVDDILDVEGDPQIMGKAAGSDLLNEKITFPAVIGLDQSKKYAEQLIDSAIDAVSSFDEAAQPLRAIARYVINRKR
jgi:geranylgeranyl diphosphate synthase type II